MTGGWIALTLIGMAVLAALCFGGVARSQWALLGAAVLLAVAGYAWQQHAALPGRPAAGQTVSLALDAELIDLRGALLGRFTGDGAYLIASDALMRRGSRASGAQVVLMGLGAYPRSLTLWVGLGTALAQHDGGMSPPARLAFDQASHLAPDHPAPPFFRGLAYARAGDLRAARRNWARALALCPPGVSYRVEIARRLAALDRAIGPRDVAR